MDRAGDDKNFFKIDRTFCVNGEWYFSTREDKDQGPFASKVDAECEIVLYVRRTIEKENMGSVTNVKKDQND